MTTGSDPHLDGCIRRARSFASDVGPVFVDAAIASAIRHDRSPFASLPIPPLVNSSAHRWWQVEGTHMSIHIRNVEVGARFTVVTIALIGAVAGILAASDAWANRNPPTCTLVSAGLLLGEFRDTARCRGGANNFTQCSADSECPGGRALRGTCTAGPSANEPCTTDADCPGGADVGYVPWGMRRSSVTRWTARPSTIGPCWASICHPERAAMKPGAYASTRLRPIALSGSTRLDLSCVFPGRTPAVNARPPARVRVAASVYLRAAAR